MKRTLCVAAILGLSLAFAAAAATAQSPGEELATIDRNFAQLQITKDAKAIEAASAAMAEDFYSFDPTRGTRMTKAA